MHFRMASSAMHAAKGVAKRNSTGAWNADKDLGGGSEILGEATRSSSSQQHDQAGNSYTPNEVIQPHLKRGSSYLTQKLDLLEAIEDAEEPSSMYTLNLAVGAIVCLNAVTFAFETDTAPRDSHGYITYTLHWFILESCFCTAYIVDIALRLRWAGLKWLYSIVNMFDVGIVVCMVLDTWILTLLASSMNLSMLSFLRLLRLMRVMRLLRVIKFFRGFYAVVMAFRHAMGSIAWICGMMAFGLFIMSLFTTNFIGHGEQYVGLDMGGRNADERFGTIFRSMFSMFELMTLESWNEVWRPIVEREPAMFIFLVTFIMIFTFGLLNMIVAMVVEKTIFESRRLDEFDEASNNKRMRMAIHKMKVVFEEADEDASGDITLKEFENAIENSEVVREALAFLELPVKDTQQLFHMLDVDRDGCLKVEEFMEGCEKVSGATSTQRDVIATYAEVRSLNRHFQELRSERKQFVLDIIHPGMANVSKKDLATKLASMYKVHDSGCIQLFGFKTAFGGGRSSGFGLIYENKDKMKKFEPKYRLIRAGVLSDKKGAGRRGKKDTKNRMKKVRGKDKTKAAASGGKKK